MSRLGHLTDQRKRFVEEYVITGNATKSALAAGYKDSPSLSNQACKLRRELFKEINDETNIFIIPGFEFKIATGLLTNFHLP